MCGETDHATELCPHVDAVIDAVVSRFAFAAQHMPWETEVSEASSRPWFSQPPTRSLCAQRSVAHPAATCTVTRCLAACSKGCRQNLLSPRKAISHLSVWQTRNVGGAIWLEVCVENVSASPIYLDYVRLDAAAGASAEQLAYVPKARCTPAVLPLGAAPYNVCSRRTELKGLFEVHISREARLLTCHKHISLLSLRPTVYCLPCADPAA